MLTFLYKPIKLYFQTAVLFDRDSLLFYYGAYPELAQKAIEGANVRCRNMHVLLRWLKILIVKFLFDLCSKY